MRQTFFISAIVFLALTVVTTSCNKDEINNNPIETATAGYKLTLDGTTYTAGSDSCTVIMYSNGVAVVTASLPGSLDDGALMLTITNMGEEATKDVCADAHREDGEEMGYIISNCSEITTLVMVDFISLENYGSYVGISGTATRKDESTIVVTASVKKVNPYARHENPILLDEEYNLSAELTIGTNAPVEWSEEIDTTPGI
jgi:hypothetical protein